MEGMSVNLSIVIPACNEEVVIEKTLCDLEEKLKIKHEVIVVNDHSTDGTAEIVKKIALKYKNIRLIFNYKSPGFTEALKTGFENVRYNIIVPIMADFSDDILSIGKMLEKINEGYDLICASRYMKGGNKLGGRVLQSCFSRLVCLSIYWLIKIPTHDVTNSFKMYRKEILEGVDIKKAGFAVSMQITLKAFFKEYRITEIPTVWKSRIVGQSNFKVLKEFKNYIKWYLWALAHLFK